MFFYVEIALLHYPLTALLSSFSEIYNSSRFLLVTLQEICLVNPFYIIYKPPSPLPFPMTSSPCSVCSKKVFDWHKAILCDLCQKWVHYKCNKFDNSDYRYHTENPNADFSCISCVEDNLPFSKIDVNQFTIAVNRYIRY